MALTDYHLQLTVHGSKLSSPADCPRLQQTIAGSESLLAIHQLVAQGGHGFSEKKENNWYAIEIHRKAKNNLPLFEQRCKRTTAGLGYLCGRTLGVSMQVFPLSNRQ
jgi:hypothetical protein